MLSKICLKCRVEKSTDEFSKDNSKKNGLASRCKVCRAAYNTEYRAGHREEAKVYAKRYSRLFREKRRVSNEKYRASLGGYLYNLHNRMLRRCRERESYVVKGIRCLFTPDGFVEYAVGTLQVDPHGKDCHRIDNDGHYEPGNIEFLSPEDHGEKHGRHFKNCREQEVIL